MLNEQLKCIHVDFEKLADGQQELPENLHSFEFLQTAQRLQTFTGKENEVFNMRQGQYFNFGLYDQNSVAQIDYWEMNLMNSKDKEAIEAYKNAEQFESFTWEA